jgi:uncharacterized protein with HEPN domain
MQPDERRDIASLRDMLEAAREVVEFTLGKSWDDYRANKQLRRSVERSVEIVGEAARRVSRERQAELTTVPWDRIIPARHRLAHEYDRIDDTIVWSIATRHIPVLITILVEILPPDPPEPQDPRGS